MKDKIISAILIVIVAILIIYTDFSGNRVIVYDCRLSEISPDYPRKVVEECRRLRLEDEREKSINLKNTI
jgi:hypothetical protein